MKAFENAASTLIVVDAKADENKNVRKHIFSILNEKYKEFAGDRLSEQLGKDGFCYALKNSATGDVIGFAAGVVYESQTAQGKVNTAAFTYVAVKGNDVEATKKLNDDMLADLTSRRNVSAVFVEVYNQGEKSNVRRNKADAKMYADMGLVKAPIAYLQPMEVGSTEPAYENLDMHVLFTSLVDAKARSAVTLAHLETFTKIYDTDLENPKNVELLAAYKTALKDYDWGMGTSKPAPGLKQS